MTIRALLDALDDLIAGAIDRLSDIRGLGGRGREAKCASLARSYGGDHVLFLDDLRKVDLVALLGDPTTFGQETYHLPSASMYSKSKLTTIALVAFRDDEVPPEFVEVDEAENDENLELENDELERQETKDADEDEDEDEDADDGDEVDHTGADYERKFRRELSFSRENAARPLWAYQEDAVEVVLESLDPLQPKILHLATGGGKTRVANTIVNRWRATHTGAVLWITKDWRLLKQAAMDLGSRHQDVKLVRLGGDGHVLHPMPERTSGTVVYTTVHTLMRRTANESLAGVLPSLVVWDECHWGEHARLGKILTICQHMGVPVLGLTLKGQSSRG